MTLVEACQQEGVLRDGVKLRLHSRQKPRQRNFEPSGDDFEVQDGDVALASLYISQETAVQTDFLSHDNLSPTMPFSQPPNTFS